MAYSFISPVGGGTYDMAGNFAVPNYGVYDPANYSFGTNALQTNTSQEQGGNMDPISTTLMGVSAVSGLFGGLFGGGTPNAGKPYSLPPEMELQMLDYFQQSLGQIGQMMFANQQLYDIYDQRMGIAERMLNGTIPSEAGLKELTQTTMKVAQAFGGDALKAIQSGYLDEYTTAQLKDMTAVEEKDFTDPRVENQINEQRRQLEQDLSRSGVGPAQRAIALREFENSANDTRFSAAEQLRTGMTQRGMARIGANLQARNQGYSQALGAFGAAQGQLQFAQQGIGMLGNMAGARYTAGTQALGVQRQLQGDIQNYYNQIGQYNLSKQTKQAMESGLIGPGTMYQQTGVARREQGNYKNWVAEQEKAATKGLGGNPAYGAAPYQAYAYNRQRENTKVYGNYTMPGYGGYYGPNPSWGQGWQSPYGSTPSWDSTNPTAVRFRNPYA